MLVRVNNLVKFYENKKALSGVTFSIKKGEIVGFVGVNGAGKTSTFNIITGYTKASSGEVFIDGLEVSQVPLEVRKKIGYLPEVPPLYQNMTVIEYLRFVYKLKKLRRENCDYHINTVCKKLGIFENKIRLIRNLSKGFRQRVGFASAILGDPPIIILDEPTSGLDPKQVVEMRGLIRSLKKEHTVILSSHILSEIQEICSRIIIIDNGQIIADDTTENILKKIQFRKNLLITVEGDKKVVLSVLQSVIGVKSVDVSSEIDKNICEYSIILGDVSDLDLRKNVFFSLAKGSLPILSMSFCGQNLENVFLRLTERKSSRVAMKEKSAVDVF